MRAGLRPFGSTGRQVPVIGQGTWQMGLEPEGEVRALREGLDLGLVHVDTAELYGAAEDVVGQAIRGRREQVFLVSKVIPDNASRAGTIAACERSLRRLGTDHLDVYLLHWPGSHPLAETMGALEELVRQGKTRAIGVSNFDLPELRLAQAALGRERLACNQVYYDLEHRGIERRLLPWCQAEGIALVGYSPFGSAGRLPAPSSPAGRVLARVAAAHGATPAQVVLAFLTRAPGTFTIPKASRLEHVRDNAGALTLELSEEEVGALEQAFPAPPGDVPLATL